MLDTPKWQWILATCGVLAGRAQLWAPLFEKHVRAAAFSRGAAELPDFIGHTLHETRMLRALEEDLDYTAERIRELGQQQGPNSRWRSLAPIADQLEHNPQALAEAAYGGRIGNGPRGSGDGWKYRGSGIPMVTGLDNYRLLQGKTGLPLVEHPELLRDPDTALRCGVLWWEARVPDRAIGDSDAITRAVGGGSIGLAARTTLTTRARAALARWSGT